MTLQQTTGFIENLLHLVGLDWTMPYLSTLIRSNKTLPMNIPYRGSKGPLRLLIDSTGIKGDGERHARKHRRPKRQVWIRTLQITKSHIGDAPIFTDLLSQIPADEEIASVTLDGPYYTRKRHNVIAVLTPPSRLGRMLSVADRHRPCRRTK